MYRLSLLCLLLTVLPTHAQPKKYALLVGVNKYEHAEMNRPSPLEYAEADVKDMAELLRESGYEVDLLLGKEATRSAVDAKIKGLAKKGDAEGVVLVGLSGHGQQMEKDEDAYYCPYDTGMRLAERDGKPVKDKNGKQLIEPDPATLVKLTDIVVKFELSPAGSRILLADCCRNDPTTGKGRAVGSGIKTDLLPKNTAVLLSCSEGQQVYENKKWEHGAFFYYVLRGLRDGKGTVASLNAYLEENVANDVKSLRDAPRQEPHVLFNAGRLDFRIERGGPKPGEVVEVEIAKGVKMKFCWIPAGKAQLGSPKSEQDYITKTFHDGKRPDYLDRETEAVRGEFTTKGFWMAKYPVTQEEWQTVMGENPSFFKPSQDDVKKAGITDTSRFPVEKVSWDDCQDFLKKMNDRETRPASMGKGKFALPHEDEWEYACRGGKGNRQPFYFGDELNGKQANCDGSYPFGTTTKGPYLERTSKVGSYESVAPHPWGLCDMAGNVYQWCSNKYDSENRRVLRGGSWFNFSWYCRSAFRNDYAPDYRYFYFGFRVVVVLP